MAASKVQPNNTSTLENIPTPSHQYPSPTPGASLLLAFKPAPSQRRTFLIIGSNNLAAVRAFAALEAGYHVVISDEGNVEDVACKEVRWRVQMRQVEWRCLASPRTRVTTAGCTVVDEEDVTAVEDLLDGFVDLCLVCVTDTLIPASSSSSTICRRPRTVRSAEAIVKACRKRNLAINVADTPALCDFTFPATHRFTATLSAIEVPSLNNSEGEGTMKSKKGGARGLPTSLQIAVTTNGKACRLAARIKREIVSTLPRDVGVAVDNVGKMRNLVGACADARVPFSSKAGDHDEDAGGVAIPLNTPVPQGDAAAHAASVEEERLRRMRWIAQVSEYWPIEKLASLGESEMSEALQKWRKDVEDSKDAESVTKGNKSSGQVPPPPADGSVSTEVTMSRHGLDVCRPHGERGRILLVGSGPGHPSLLTVAARKALIELGTLILSDKLVPAQVLALIPKERRLYIAKKFPGNADGAQNELMEMALEGARRGETVVRLKQGDPFVYGRGGEEVLYFRQHGFEPLVIPGISSALAGPLLAGIPVTQRGVAESVMICTGVGRQGREVELPGYERQRSLAILMGVARITQIVAVLTESESEGTGRRKGRPYPLGTPIAVIERASCPDQRAVMSTLENIEEALARCGEQRPPGMMLVGWAALALTGSGDLTVLNDAIEHGQNMEVLTKMDAARVNKWFGGEKSMVVDGLPTMWDLF